MKGFLKGYYQFSVWAMRLAYVNLLWVVFTIVGLGFLGLMPATAGMFAVVRKWVSGEDEIKVFPTFWSSYRKEFVKSNLVGYILIGIGYILYIEFQILRAQESLVYFIASFGVIALFILLLIILLFVFPVFVHFNLSVFQNIRWAVTIGIMHPILTIVLGGVVGFMCYIAFMTIPALLVFFGGSVSAFILTWGASKTFSKFEHANA